MSVQQRIYDVTDYESYKNPYSGAQPIGNLFSTSQYWNASTPSTDDGDKIGYLEGYARGYVLKSTVKAEVPYHVMAQEFNLYITPKNFVQAASILNLPEFATQLYRDAVSGNFSKSSYMMLNAFPFNPPATAGTNMTEITPAHLFKNSAGVYSMPYPYILWLGGIWQNWQVLPSVVDWNTELFLTFDGSRFSNILHTSHLNMNDPDYVLDYTSNDEGKIVVVDPAKLVYSTYYGDKFMTIGGGVYSSKPANSNTVKLVAPNLNGLGIHYDLIKALFPYFNNGKALPTPLYNQFIFSFEQQNLRLFTSYLWMDETTRKATLPAYAAYGIGNYTVGVEPTLDFTQDAFTVYTACWNWVYFHFIDSINQGSDSAAAIKDAITKLDAKLSADNVNTIVNAMFVERKAEKSIVYNKASDRQFTLNLIGNITPREFLMDFISKEVLQMYNNIQANADDNANTKFLINDAARFWATLYPSAGGVFGLQYLVEDTEKFNQKSRLWAYAWENAVLNSCRTLWYTGPTANQFFNQSPTLDDADNANEIRKYDLIGALGDTGVYYSTLNQLDNLILFNKNDFDGTKKTTVPKELRTYVLPSAIEESQRGNYSPVLITDFIDYLGTGLLDFCQSEFTQAVTDSTLQNLLLSLMVVDEFDFADTITVQGVEFSKADQIDIITKYHQLFDNSYVVRDTSVNPKTNKFQYVNYCVVMNTALSVAQYNKAVKVVKKILADRRLVNIPSVFDYAVSSEVNEPVKNSVARRMVVDPTGLKYNGFSNMQQSADNIRMVIFGIQEVPLYRSRDDANRNFAKYITRDYTTSVTVADANALTYFYQTLNVEPNVDVIRVSKEYAQYFLKQLHHYTDGKYSTDPATLYARAFQDVVELMTAEFSTGKNYVDDYLKSVKTILDATSQASIQNAVTQAKEDTATDYGLLKTKTYYNVKSIFDNWLQMGFNGLDADGKADINLFFNYNSVLSLQNTHILNQQENKTTLFDQFLFVDRANRNIGGDLLVNIDWLKNFFENNYGYSNINTNISIYSFMSELAKKHSAVLHALPAFIKFDTLTVQEGETYAGNLFNAYDFIINMETKPKFIFQFIGNVGSELNTSSNKAKRSQSKSFNISKWNKVPDQIPIDLQQSSASAMAFIVDFGSPTQQMFSNLQLDQNEYQNTEEYYQLITKFTQDKAQTQSGDLFAIFTARSYTAQIDTLGNMMIQPLMYFDLVNIPLFTGTYWITNVKHSIVPNDIKTTFKGVRQPFSTLPLRQDVMLQLARMNAASVLGITDIGELTPTPTPDGGGGGNLPASIDEVSFDQVLANNVNKIVLVNNSTLFESDLYQHFVKYHYMNQGVPYAALKMILALESGGSTNSAAKDKNGKLLGAAGIIQWIPSTTKGLLKVINNNPLLKKTAQSLNIAVDTVVNTISDNVNFITAMTLEQQIFLAKVYFADNKGNVSATSSLDAIWERRSSTNPWSSALNMYATVFYPKALPHWSDDNFLLCDTRGYKAGDKMYDCVVNNKWYSNDPNKPVYITVGTFKKGVMNIVNKRFKLV